MGLIYLDTCLLIYATERDPVFGEATLAALAALPDARFAISPLIKLECLVRPIKTGDLVQVEFVKKGTWEKVIYHQQNKDPSRRTMVNGWMKSRYLSNECG